MIYCLRCPHCGYTDVSEEFPLSLQQGHLWCPPCNYEGPTDQFRIPEEGPADRGAAQEDTTIGPQTPIQDFLRLHSLPLRVRKALVYRLPGFLHRSGLDYLDGSLVLADLLRFTGPQLLKGLRSFGPTSLETLRKALREHGLRLADEAGQEESRG